MFVMVVSFQTDVVFASGPDADYVTTFKPVTQRVTGVSIQFQVSAVRYTLFRRERKINIRMAKGAFADSAI
jgi:hypothetical protein